MKNAFINKNFGTQALYNNQICILIHILKHSVRFPYIPIIRVITDNHYNLYFELRNTITLLIFLIYIKLGSAVNNLLSVITFSENFKTSKMKRLMINEFIFPVVRILGII